MPISREDLEKKGWTEEEIDYTFNVIDTAKDKKTAFVHFLDGAISWFGLFVVFLGSLILSVVIMPFFLTIKGFFLYFTVFILAFVLGVVFNFLLDQINQMGKEEKIVGEVFLPIISLIDVYVMFGIANVLINTLKMNYEPHNQVIFAIVYVVALSGPFYISHSKILVKKYLHFGRKNNDQQAQQNQQFQQPQQSQQYQQSQIQHGNYPMQNMQNMRNMQNAQNNAQNVRGMNPQNLQNNQRFGQVQNNNNNPVPGQAQNQQSQQDYYQAYLEEQKKQEARKMLYEQRLKEKLLERLNK